MRVDLTRPLPIRLPQYAHLYPTNPLGSIWFAGLNGARNQSYATKTHRDASPRFRVDNIAELGPPRRRGAIRFAMERGHRGWIDGLRLRLRWAVRPLPARQHPWCSYRGVGRICPFLQVLQPATLFLTSRLQTPREAAGRSPIPLTSLPIQNGWQWTAGVQRRLPGNMVAEAQYVGSHWENMMFEADVNQLPANKLGQGQAARPYPQFSGIGVGSGGSRTGTYNGISNYQSAQFMLHVPTNHGLAAEVSYTWSRLYDDMDDSGWGNQFGDVYYQDAYNPSANYGPSNFNRPNSVKGSVLYALPFGKGHQYLSSTLADAVLGGWTASGDFEAESGVPFTVIMNSSIPDGSLGGSDGNGAAALYPNKVGNPSSGGQSLSQWFNQLAYAAPAVNTFGTNPRNSLRGPDLTDIDFSLAKSWSIPGWESRQSAASDGCDRPTTIQASHLPATNSIQPRCATGIPDPSVGQITATTINGRTVQLTGRFQF